MTKPSILSPARGPPSGVCHFQDSETEYEWKKCDSLLGGCYPRIDSSTLMITLRDFLRVGGKPFVILCAQSVFEPDEYL